jgi:2',3'-cyclic-nucleotide 2'-phosphodiesterase (5'-nucleotidase family)
MAGKNGGGLAPLMTLIERERARARGQALVTFGGDLISPSVESSLTRGSHMIALMNAIGVQAAVLGNHEFDFGPEILAERIAESGFPWLASNVRDRDGASFAGTEDTRLVTLNGIKIGMFGVLSPKTSTLSKPGPGVHFAPPEQAALRAVRDLRARGAEVVVALTHLRLDDDIALARAVPEIDLILGGHDHYPVAIARGGALIVKAGQDARYLAVIDVDIDREATGPGTKTEIRPVHWRFLATRGVPPEPAVAALIDRITARFDASLGQRVGMTETALDGRRNVVRGGESTLGNLIADAMREASGAEAALINGGGIRGDKLFPPGSKLTRRDLMEAVPFGDVTVVLELDGATLRAALEHGVGLAERQAGRFPQVSGLRFIWDRAAPPGARVRSVTVGGAPLDPARRYRVAAGAYIAGGGDGYEMLKSAKRIVDTEAGSKVVSQLIDHFLRLGKVSPRIEGRILEAR